MKEIPTRYDHTRETTIYERWLTSSAFKPTGKGEPFSLVIPPPNVTGDLHLGHALGYSLEDTIARHQRRLGRDVLVLPGMDHAAIAVQALVEKKLQKEGKRRTDLTREQFLEEVKEWISHYMPRMEQSLKRLGLSADWNRFRFTMDEHSQTAVRTAFIELYKKGLIYRGNYLVNWDPKLQTAISDDEVVYQEVPGKLYWIKYGPITVATTRPETKLGDTAIAVSPKDARYKKYIGQEIEFTNEFGKKQTLPVVADEAVEMGFGTGALKVTPAHDHIDWQLGETHHLDVKQVIDKFGRITEGYEPYSGLKVTEAREKIVADLQERGLMEKITDYIVRQPTSDRSGAVVEPLPSTQWFMKITAIRDQAIKVVKNNEIKFYPKSFEKTYFHWLNNLHDWCISRQLWWGHQIPAWYDEAGQVYVAETQTEAEKLANGKKLSQETDVLDTWFSSGLWPFSTMGWPNQDATDFKRYFPTSLLETGHDIIFFWVARMIILSLALTDQVPFRDVYFHGLVTDEKGQKMSKSKGNGVDAMAVIEKYGADALRMSLLGGTTAGLPQRFSEQKVLKYRNFTTKIWNASRFVLMIAEDASANRPSTLDEIEQEFLIKLEKLEKTNLKLFKEYKIGVALEELYEFFWHVFADKFLEYEKKIINGTEDQTITYPHKQFLKYCLSRLLAMLSDFAPFLTQEIDDQMVR